MRQSGSLKTLFWMNGAFPRHEILQEDQKKTGLFESDIRFQFVFLHFLQKIKNCPFWIIQILQTPRYSNMVIYSSSVADFFRISSPQVPLSVSKKSFWSDFYFLSGGSFNMAKNRKKRVNQLHSGSSNSRSRFFPDMRFSQGVQKRTQLSENRIFRVTFMSHFSSKFDNVPKITRFRTYWMIRIFPGKSGRVTSLR